MAFADDTGAWILDYAVMFSAIVAGWIALRKSQKGDIEQAVKDEVKSKIKDEVKEQLGIHNSDEPAQVLDEIREHQIQNGQMVKDLQDDVKGISNRLDNFRNQVITLLTTRRPPL